MGTGTGIAVLQQFGEALEGRQRAGFCFGLLRFAQWLGVEAAGEALPALGTTTRGLAQMTRAEVLIQTQRCNTREQV